MEKNKNNRVKEISEDLKQATEIHTVAKSNGGKTLIKTLIRDILGNLDLLCERHEKLTHQEFVAICAGLKTKKDLLDVLVGAEKDKDYLQSLLEESLQAPE